MKYLLPWLFIFFAVNTIAQQQDVSGEIITTQGDTLIVELKLSKINSNSVGYRLKNATGSFKEMSSDDIKVVYSRQAAYFSMNVDGIRKLAKRLINGPISAFEVQEDLETLFLLENENGNIIVLNDENYKRKIQNELENCINNSELNNLNFSRKYIEQIVYKYNACKYPDKYEPVEIKAQPRISIKLVAGVSSFFVKSNTDIVYSTTGNVLFIDEGANLTYDLGLDFSFELSKMIYELGLHFTPYYVNVISEFGEGKINYSFISFPVSSRYRINDKINVGVGCVSCAVQGYKIRISSLKMNSKL